jgi:hypothetical protein
LSGFIDEGCGALRTTDFLEKLDRSAGNPAADRGFSILWDLGRQRRLLAGSWANGRLGVDRPSELTQPKIGRQR